MNDDEKLKLEAKLRQSAPLIKRLSEQADGKPDHIRTAFELALEKKFPLVRELTEKQMEGLLLRLIAEQPADGLELINNLTRAHFCLKGGGEGVIYGILSAMESSGLVEGRWRESSAKMVKSYHLTESGTNRLQRHSAASAETSNWANLVLGRTV